MATVPLHPEIEPFRDLVPIPDLDSANLTMLREMELGEPPELSDEVVRTEHTVLEDEGVFVRVHTPNGLEGPAPCVYTVHGGGYVAGTEPGSGEGRTGLDTKVTASGGGGGGGGW